MKDIIKQAEEALEIAKRFKAGQTITETEKATIREATENMRSYEKLGIEKAGRIADHLDKIFGESDGNARANFANQFGDLQPNRIEGPASARDYRSMFYNNKHHDLDRGEFRNFEDFLQAVESGLNDPRLKRAHVEGTPSAGGFLVPEEFASIILDQALEGEIVRPLATVWPMTSNVRKVPGWDGSDHRTSVYGGFSAEWLGEGSTGTRKQAKLRQIKLEVKKLGIYTQASRELIQDGLSFEQSLGGALISAAGFYMDSAFLTGTGAGQPKGVLIDNALIVVAKEGSQAAATIMFENLVKMWSRLHPASMTKAVWVANPTIIPQLMTLGLTLGTSGAPVYMPPAGASASPYGTLLGRPLMFTEKLPSLGNQGDILLADFTQYAVGLRQELLIDKSNAPGWLQDLTDYRVIARVDGQGTWSEPVTPKNGNTLSWCVTLAERS